MAWQTPKTDWAPDYYIDYTDFNRIESNIAIHKEGLDYYDAYADDLYESRLIVSSNVRGVTDGIPGRTFLQRFCVEIPAGKTLYLETISKNLEGQFKIYEGTTVLWTQSGSSTTYFSATASVLYANTTANPYLIKLFLKTDTASVAEGAWYLSLKWL